MIRTQVFLLYRTKLRLCRYMGYKFGDWRPYMGQSKRNIQLRDLNRYIKTNVIGKYIWNNVRLHYKLMRHEKDSLVINNSIDEAFLSLKYINYITNMYNQKHKQLLMR